MATFLVLVCLFAAPGLSHKRLKSPTPRDDTTAPRDAGPCGGVSFEEAYADGLITDWKAGETVEIILYEEIYHSQQPIRFAISDENDEDFESCIWLNHVPQHTEGGGDMDLKIELTVPDFTCNNCTLQLLALQTADLDESTCCVYHPDCETMYGDLETEDGSSPCCPTTQYYSCANININGGSRSRNAVCKQPNNWGLRDFKCNYFMAEESSNAWKENNDGSLSLITSGTISGLDPTSDSHCSETEFLVDVDTDCQSMISSASTAEEASLLQGGKIQADGVFAFFVVILLVISITVTYCLTKDKGKEAEETNDTVDIGMPQPTITSTPGDE